MVKTIVWKYAFENSVNGKYIVKIYEQNHRKQTPKNHPKNVIDQHANLWIFNRLRTGKSCEIEKTS